MQNHYVMRGFEEQCTLYWIIKGKTNGFPTTAELSLQKYSAALTSSSPQSISRYLRDHAAHIVPDAVVVEKALYPADGTDGEILIPEPPAREVHDVLFRDRADDALNFLRAEAAARGDDLAANVLGHGGGAVEREEDRGFELGLGALCLGFGNAVREARPLTKSEVHQVIDASNLVSNEVDAPEPSLISPIFFEATTKSYPVSL